MIRGLILLKTLTEELVSNRDDVPAARKDELKMLLTQQVPGILMLVQRILDNVFDVRILSPLSTQTPMPSPSNTLGSPYASAPIGAGMRSRSTSGSSGKGSFRDRLFGHIINDTDRFVHGGKLDDMSMTVASLALEIMLQLFSWISLSDHVTPALLATLFKYAGLNNEETVALGVLAMSCVNEMLSRSCVPRDFEEYLVQIFRQIFQILQDLTDDNPQKSGNALEELDSTYREKFIDFINLFLTQHMPRVESSLSFPMHEFLEQFFRFTFMQPSLETFQECLRTWSIFLDHLLERLSNQTRLVQTAGGLAESNGGLISAPLDHVKYKAGLLAFVRELLKRILFASSGQDLKDIDDVNENSEGQTEWDQYLLEAVDILGKITDLYPENVLEQLLPLFASNSSGLLQAHTILSNNSASREDSTRLFCFMKDLRSCLVTLCSVSTVFTNAFEVSLGTTVQLVARILDIAEYCHSHVLYRHGPQFRKLSCQAFVSLEAYCPWLSMLGASISSDPSRQSAFEQLVARMIDVSVQTIFTTTGHNDDEIVSETAAKLLLAIATTVRPPSFANTMSIANLTSALALLPMTSARNVHAAETLSPSLLSSSSPPSSPSSRIPKRTASSSIGGGAGLFPSVRRICTQALVSAVVLPHAHTRENQQAWLQRAEVLKEVVRPLLYPLKEIASSASFQNTFNQPQVKQQVASSLDVAMAILDSVHGGSRPPKQIVHDAISEIFPMAVSFLRVYVHESDTMEVIVGFFLRLLEVLRAQLSEAFVAETLDVFFSVLGGDRLANQLAQVVQANTASLLPAEVASRFLTLLTLIVDEPGKHFDVFIGNILGLCLSPLSVLVSSNENPAVVIVRPAFYHLVHTLLLNKWRYFSSLPQNAPDVVATRLAQLDGLFQVIANGLQSSDIDTYQRNLRGIEKLQEVNKLYQRDVFRRHLYGFLEILLVIVLNKSHELLRDETMNCIYNMASVDFDSFYGPFIDRILAGLAHLSTEHKALLRHDLQSEKDLPTFTTNLQRFASDYAFCCRLVSNPETSFIQ